MFKQLFVADGHMIKHHEKDGLKFKTHWNELDKKFHFDSTNKSLIINFKKSPKNDRYY